MSFKAPNETYVALQHLETDVALHARVAHLSKKDDRKGNLHTLEDCHTIRHLGRYTHPSMSAPKPTYSHLSGFPRSSYSTSAQSYHTSKHAPTGPSSPLIPSKSCGQALMMTTTSLSASNTT